MLLFPETATHSPRPAAYATSKLRDSCQACAVSKVKCPREKPACSRCSSRGIICEYFFTKRPGRRRAPSTITPVTIAASVPAAPGCCSDNNIPANSSGLSTSSHRSSWSQYGVATCAFQPPLGPYAPRKDAVPTGPSPDPIVPTSPPALDTTASEDFFSVFLSPSHLSWDLSEPDPLYGYRMHDSAPSDGNPPARDGSASLFIPDEMGSLDMAVADAWSAADLLMQAESSTAPTTSKSQDAPAAVTPENKVEESWVPCACLTEALDLIKGLSSLSSTTWSAILLENKLGIEAVERLLACPWCAEDSFLLAVLAMAVLRVVERYAAASQHQVHGESDREDNTDRAAANRRASSSCSTSSTSSGSGKSYNKHSNNSSSSNGSSSNGISSTRSSPVTVPLGRHHHKTIHRSYNCHEHGDDKSRRSKHAAASRQVLGELHRAQRVVNKLSPRLRAAGMAASETRTGAVPPAALALLSEGTLEGVARDLRKGLRTLSADIIRCLQQR